MSNFLQGTKTFLKSPLSYVVIVLSALVLYIVLANVNTLLERFGFETKGRVMAQLSEVRSQNRTLTEQVGELKLIIATQGLICNAREEAVEGHLSDIKDVSDIAHKYINMVITDTVVNQNGLIVADNDPYKESSEEISVKNFNTLQSVYIDMFGG